MAAAVVLSSCTGAPQEVEAGAETEPLPEAQHVETPEPDASAEPDPGDEADPNPDPVIEEGEPLYAPLPELKPDPDNDIHDELELELLTAAARAYTAEQDSYTSGHVDEEVLSLTHVGEAYEDVVGTVAHLRESGGRELSPDSEVLRMYVRDFNGGSAVVRECVRTGPRTGLYEQSSLDLIESAGVRFMARERLVELVRLEEDKPLQYRVTEIGLAEVENC
ncbi:hypothetical protein [Egicoccus halophilus]|uniref:hypothetical protein n=1 Tax=Egicoccus halophilus TaxID=1670830 RepID=UPI001030461E|nr:hypothetical protein [Egicoccus halophilus]